MRLEDWLHERDGAAHTAEIYAAGFSRHAVASAVDSGRMLRLRRSWIASRSCDRAILAAVGVSGRLTCVTAARRLALWTPAHAEFHVAVAPTAARFDSAGLRVHWSSGPAPIGPHAVLDPLINVLHHVARCQEPGTALAVWESALNKRLIAPEVLARVEWRSARASRITAAPRIDVATSKQTHACACADTPCSDSTTSRCCSNQSSCRTSCVRQSPSSCIGEDEPVTNRDQDDHLRKGELSRDSPDSSR